MEPIDEGRAAARSGRGFVNCPYSYVNSNVRNMDEYAATGNNAKRDLWFEGWTSELMKMEKEKLLSA